MFTKVQRIVQAFEDCTLERSEWTHETHLLVGLWYVLNCPPGTELMRMREGIKRFNEATGVPNTARSGYHETITRFYLDALRMFVNRNWRLPQQQLFDRVLEDRVADRDFLTRHYPKEVLASELARKRWVRPAPGASGTHGWRRGRHHPPTGFPGRSARARRRRACQDQVAA